MNSHKSEGKEASDCPRDVEHGSTNESKIELPDIGINDDDDLPSVKENPKLFASKSVDPKLLTAKKEPFLPFKPVRPIEERARESVDIETGVIVEEKEEKSRPAPLVKKLSDPTTSREKRAAHDAKSDSKRSRIDGEGLSSQPTTPSLIRQASLFRPTFYCEICLENVNMSQAYSFHGNGGCNHTFCIECLRSYLVNRISEAQIRNPCPVMSEKCHAEANIDDLKAICPDMIEKYDRFSRMKADTNNRDCPKCKHMQSADPSTSTITCLSCNYEYCFFHSDAHHGQSCGQYARSIRLKELSSTLAVMRSTKKCPSCKSATEKNGGCNHMTCRECRKSWCWLCGRSFDSSGTHFGEFNLLGCPGLQFAPDWFSWILYLYRLLWLCLFLLALPIICSLVGLAVTAACIVLPFAFPASIAAFIRMAYDSDFSFYNFGSHFKYNMKLSMVILASLIVIPVAMVWFAIGFSCCMPCAPIVAFCFVRSEEYERDDYVSCIRNFLCFPLLLENAMLEELGNS